MAPRSLIGVLAEISETASETLELQEVFDRVAASIRGLIPFDHMGVVRILDGERAVKHATTLDCPENESPCSQPAPLTIWSPRMRPTPRALPRINDAQLELDRSFPADASCLQEGMRSAMWEPFRSADSFSGGVWLSANRPHAFTDEHQETLRPIAAILGSAVEHWRIWDAEKRRRERLDQLEVVLAALAESLDVRDVFERISTAVQPVLPHTVLVLTELDDSTRTARLVATAGAEGLDVPKGPIPLSEQELERHVLDFEIFRDIPAEVKPHSERSRIMLTTGMRSWLRVPIRLSGRVRGALGFFDKEPSRYGPADVEVARRIADRMALALSHQRLADEARIAAQERERAERLAATVETLARELDDRGSRSIVGNSRSWKEVLVHVGRVASSDTTVLITGESGTGKEVVSRLLHHGSTRADKPLVAINCAALPEALLESELFGHEKGAFTGAVATKIGRVEQAAGGTLFLDEIAEMSPLVQAKFLRVLQEREFQRLGGSRTLQADVRVIAATNRALPAAIARGEFREDLYYRLNVFELRVPALRERTEDILPLAESFIEDLGRSMGRPAAGISRDAREWLLAYSWPGNIRELRNAIERAILLCDGGLITREHLPAVVGHPETVRAASANGTLQGSATFPPGGVNLEEVDRTFVEKALQQARGNRSRAARLLGLTRSQLYSRIERYGLE